MATSISQAVQSNSKARFAFVDGLRAIAALWVLLYHANPKSNLQNLSQILPSWFIQFIFEKGRLGVPIFFVISGFVAAYSLRSTYINFNSFKVLNLRRFIRLTPTYYVSILIVIGFALLASHVKAEPFQLMGERLSLGRFLAHLIYAQEILGFTNFNDVYWTLCLEIQFYLVFIFIIFLSQILVQEFNFIQGRALAFYPFMIFSLLYPLNILSINESRPVWIFSMLYIFLMGSLAYWSASSQMRFVWFAGLMASVGLLTFNGIYRNDYALTTAIVSALLFFSLRYRGMQDWLNWAWIQQLGKISYSLFLTHTPVLGATVFITYRVFGQSTILNDLIALILGISISVVFAWFVWKLVEEPSMKFTRKVEFRNTSQ